MPHATTTTTLEDYNTSTKITNVTDTPEKCPFCGSEDIGQHGITGVNAEICEHCLENINLYTPQCFCVYGDTQVFNTWTYLPVTDNWNGIGDPTFARTTTGDRLDADELSPSELEVVEQIATQGEPELGWKEDGLKREYVQAVNQALTFDGGIGETKRKRLQSRVPRVSAIIGERVYSVDVEEVSTVLGVDVQTASQSTLV